MSEKKELLEESKKLIEKYKMMSFGVGEGYFIEPYSSSSSSSSNERPFAASIYYLLDQNDIVKFHKLDCDEIWYYHQGVGVNIYFVEKDNTLSVRQLGIGEGQKPMVIVPKNTIYGAENIDPNGYTFISCVTVPKFSPQGAEIITKKKCPNLPEKYEKFYSTE